MSELMLLHFNVQEDIVCPYCAAGLGMGCFYVNRWGNFVFLNIPHAVRIQAYQKLPKVALKALRTRRKAGAR